MAAAEEPWAGPPEDWDPDAGPSADWEELPPRGIRRWDGTPVEAGPDHDTYDRFAVAGFVLSFLVGIVGGVLCVVALFRIGGGPGLRKGRWLAVTGLVVSAVWVVVALALGAIAVRDALVHTNADDFAGEERRVAEVIDRVEQALEDGDGQAFCDDLRAVPLEGDAYRDCLLSMRSIRSERLGDLRIRSLAIEGDADVLTTAEGGDRLRWTLQRVEGDWLVLGVV